jgi:hypothetical protein
VPAWTAVLPVHNGNDLPSVFSLSIERVFRDVRRLLVEHESDEPIFPFGQILHRAISPASNSRASWRVRSTRAGLDRIASWHPQSFSPVLRRPTPELVLQEAAGLLDKSFCNPFNGILPLANPHGFRDCPGARLCVVLRY